MLSYIRYLCAVTICYYVLLQSYMIHALSSASSSSSGGKKFYGGAGVGKLVIDERASQSNSITCHYDMILVERIQGRPKTDSGLFVPQQDLPRLHICRVIAVGPGKEEENGLIVPITNIHVDDIIIAKNPWGIGPRDEETSDGKKLSFMRYQDVAAIISGGIIPDDE